VAESALSCSVDARCVTSGVPEAFGVGDVVALERVGSRCRCTHALHISCSVEAVFGANRRRRCGRCSHGQHEKADSAGESSGAGPVRLGQRSPRRDRQRASRSRPRGRQRDWLPPPVIRQAPYKSSHTRNWCSTRRRAGRRSLARTGLFVGRMGPAHRAPGARQASSSGGGVPQVVAWPPQGGGSVS
jgi:hypothetical protein